MKDERVEPVSGEGAAGLAPSRSETVISQPPARRRGRWVWGLILLGLAGAVAFTFVPNAGSLLSGKPTRTPPRPAEALPVGVARVESGAMDLVLDALGTVTPLQTATVKSRVAGQIVSLPLREGRDVKVGDVIAELDDRPYKLALDQARGQLLRDQALLKNAEIDLARYQKLVSQDSLARQQLDTQAALVQQYEGVVKTDEANVGVAELNLGFTRVTAPIAGRLGLKLSDVGAYAQPSDSTGIVTITEMAPISVVFAVPEDELARLKPRIARGDMPEVVAYDRGRRKELARGKVGSIDNQIDTTTGTVKIRAIFDNADLGLYPNQFVNVRMVSERIADALKLPQTAIQRGQQGPFVYRVEADDRVSVQQVSLGASSLDTVIVTSGLNAGDTVVVDGTDKVRAGTLVSTAGPTEVKLPPDGAAQNRRGAGGQGGQQRGGAGQGPRAAGGAQR